jgi:hypothetical protein
MLPLLAGCLLLSGCIKDPHTPPGPQPEWLLKKITAVDVFYEPNSGDLYAKYVREFSYRNNKPWRCIYSSSSFYEGDTSNLVVNSIDSFFYDNRGRVNQVTHYSLITKQTERIEKHYYSGNNQLPAKIEFYHKSSPTASLTARYSYTDTSVTCIKPYYKGGFDTTTFIFDIKGNYVMRYYSTLPPTTELSKYDNAPNPALFLNVENAMVLSPDFSSDYLTRTSKNNWTNIRSSQWDNPRRFILNELGMVIQTDLVHNFGVHQQYRYVTRYEYRHAD